LTEWALKPGGSLMFIYGHIIQVEVILTFHKHPELKHWWPLALVHNGPHKPIDARGIYAGYKSMLWYVKGDKPDRISRTMNYILDTIQSNRPDKQEDELKQSPEDVEPYIQGLTLEGETVLDPFCATGTFGIAALRNNNYFLSIIK
jgi:hypothetical protein